MAVTVEIAEAAQLAELVRRRAADGQPMADYGVAHTGVGHAPPADALHVRFRCEDAHALVEHYARDLTVRVHGGATMGQLHRLLEPSGQFLAIDADDDLTIAEVMAHHVFGPLRAGYGSVRDHLLGLAYIDGVGRDIRVGGRTVKNVAGLDVTRLMVSSLNELGLIHEATLRTFAVPGCVRMSRVTGVEAGQLLRDVDGAAPAALRGEGEHLIVTHMGDAAMVEAQLAALHRLGATVHDSHTTDLEGYRAVTAAARAWRRAGGACHKLIVPPRLLPKVAAADTLPAHGVAFVARADDAWVSQVGGYRVRYAAAPSDDTAPFHPLPADLPTLARLKAAMDPHNLFNPGRLIPVRRAVNA